MKNELSTEAIGRIADSIAKDGPAIVQRATRVRRAQQIGAGAITLGAFAALTVYTLPSSDPVPPARSIAPQPTVAKTEGRRCDAWAEPNVQNTDDGWSIEDRVVASRSPNAEVSLERTEPCYTEIVLNRGTLTVDADDLGGGTLIVKSGVARVRVVGTLFAVDATEDEVAVRVMEGTVALFDGEQEQLANAGERLSAGQSGWSRSALPSEDHDDEIAKNVHRMKRRKHRARKRSLAPAPAPAHEPTPPDVEELVRRAQQAKADKDFDRARSLYSAAGSMEGPTAEAAWIALTRLELEAGAAQAALDALERRAQRFGRGRLAVEAAYLQVTALEALGEKDRARTAAESLMKRWPNTPQADAAKRWLEQAE